MVEAFLESCRVCLSNMLLWDGSSVKQEMLLKGQTEALFEWSFFFRGFHSSVIGRKRPCCHFWGQKCSKTRTQGQRWNYGQRWIWMRWGSKTPVKGEWGRVKGSRVQRPCKVNADETQTRTRKYNETSFLFLIFFIGSSSARARAFCYAVVKIHPNPSNLP